VRPPNQSHSRSRGAGALGQSNFHPLHPVDAPGLVRKPPSPATPVAVGLISYHWAERCEAPGARRNPRLAPARRRAGRCPVSKRQADRARQPPRQRQSSASKASSTSCGDESRSDEPSALSRNLPPDGQRTVVAERSFREGLGHVTELKVISGRPPELGTSLANRVAELRREDPLAPINVLVGTRRANPASFSLTQNHKSPAKHNLAEPLEAAHNPSTPEPEGQPQGSF
jgi:hypothetical protein